MAAVFPETRKAIPARSTIAAARRYPRRAETGESVLIQDMSYEEWAGWKESLQKDTPNAIIEEKKKLFLIKDGTSFEITGVDMSGDKPIIKMKVKA